MNLFAFAHAKSVSVVALSENAIERLSAIKRNDAAGYSACLDLIENVAMAVLSLIVDPDSLDIGKTLKAWWLSEEGAQILKATYRQIEIEICKGRPTTLFQVNSIRSFRV